MHLAPRTGGLGRKQYSATPSQLDTGKNNNGEKLIDSCKSLVIFGENLSSNIHYKPYNYLIKYLVEMPSSLESILMGV